MYKTNITGKQVIDDAHVGNASMVSLYSTNAAETLTQISSRVNALKSIRFYPVAGLTVTLANESGNTANSFKLSGGMNAVLNGSKGDWIELTKKNNVWYQTSGETY